MATIAEPLITGSHRITAFSDAEKAAILRELRNILDSHPFRNSARGKQFLAYVVQHKLEGRDEFLKERMIGIEIFRRKADYATSDDSVVRVQAGEVRRRLEQYYYSASAPSPVRIELPHGSYAPEFRWETAPALDIKTDGSRGRNRRFSWQTFAAVAAVLLLLAGLAEKSPIRTPKQSSLEQFWSPVFATSQPVLICLAKPVFYRPSLDLYQRYSRTHPGTFQTEVERYDQPLPLDPKEKLVWGDLLLYHEYGVAVGDVYLAARLSALFDHINKPSQVRIGSNYSFEDLRNSPAVMVGAFNNPWTLQMTSNLRFAFVEQDGNLKIQEQGSAGLVRSRGVGPHGEILEDFAVVTRLLDAKTGQVLIAAAGLGAAGTQAAGEFISRHDYLEEAFRHAPADWQKKNLQVVLQTTVTNFVAGPPRVIATYFW
ncbi:MAG: hypothetical protein ABSF59_24025 [Candidatus Sulfotelmatobacter sp.]|jgi:hypothetical protein